MKSNLKIRLRMPYVELQEISVNIISEAINKFDLINWSVECQKYTQLQKEIEDSAAPEISYLFDDGRYLGLTATNSNSFEILLFAKCPKKKLFGSTKNVKMWSGKSPIQKLNARQLIIGFLEQTEITLNDWIKLQSLKSLP